MSKFSNLLLQVEEDIEKNALQLVIPLNDVRLPMIIFKCFLENVTYCRAMWTTKKQKYYKVVYFKKSRWGYMYEGENFKHYIFMKCDQDVLKASQFLQKEEYSAVQHRYTNFGDLISLM